MAKAKIAEQMISVLETCEHLDDYGMRSALGIADSYARGGKVELVDVRYAEDGSPISRDALADALIGILDESGATEVESKEARREARNWVNAPFTNDPAILKWREERHARYPKGIGLE